MIACNPLFWLLAMPAMAIPAIADVPPKWSVRASLQIISIPLKEGALLLPELRRRSTFDAAYRQVQELIAADKASLLAWPVFFACQNKEASERSVEEHRIPYGYDHPDGPTYSAIDVAHYTRDVNFTGIPTEFEARSPGLDVSLTSSVESAGKRIMMQLTAQVSSVLGLRRIKTGTYLSGVKGCMEQSETRESKLAVQLLISNGGQLLAGSTFAALPEPHIELYVLQASAERIDP